jgi:hypothetical protein
MFISCIPGAHLLFNHGIALLVSAIRIGSVLQKNVVCNDQYDKAQLNFGTEEIIRLVMKS